MEGQGQLTGVVFLPPPCGSLGFNSGHQAWEHVPLASELFAALVDSGQRKDAFLFSVSECSQNETFGLQCVDPSKELLILITRDFLTSMFTIHHLKIKFKSFSVLKKLKKIIEFIKKRGSHVMPLEKDDSSELSVIVTDNVVFLTWHLCPRDDGSFLFTCPTPHDASACWFHAPTTLTLLLGRCI